jgi:hypothetical protein
MIHSRNYTELESTDTDYTSAGGVQPLLLQLAVATARERRVHRRGQAQMSDFGGDYLAMEMAISLVSTDIGSVLIASGTPVVSQQSVASSGGPLR